MLCRSNSLCFTRRLHMSSRLSPLAVDAGNLPRVNHMIEVCQ